MQTTRAQQSISSGQTFLGIELGSTRIKAVLTDQNHQPIASGSHTWENSFRDGYWTYSLEEIQDGIRKCYASLQQSVEEQYALPLRTFGAIGVSAMMHGYLAFNEDNQLLAPFRTWRNTVTGEAAEALTGMFHFSIPQRWSIAHLYQAILNEEEHVKEISYLTTLAGYIHWLLTGEKVIGIGDASGMFPVDPQTKQYDEKMLRIFDEKISNKEYSWSLARILPKVLLAGSPAGFLTDYGAGLLDPIGTLQAGIPFCPPEGDAGTGMTATDSVAPNTGNVSAGTSIFAMIVLKEPLSEVYPEIDVVTTPSGEPVAMVHCNNCLGDFDAWVSLMGQAAKLMGADFKTPELYDKLYEAALAGDTDCGGLLAYNYISGEHVTGFSEGRPLFVRRPDSRFSLENVMRTHLYASLGTISIGMETLLQKENVQIQKISGHGGFFKSSYAGQRMMSCALRSPVCVMKTAGEGGPWGMAILAAYMIQKNSGETLEEYLSGRVFANAEMITVNPDSNDMNGFRIFMKSYRAGLAIERRATELI